MPPDVREHVRVYVSRAQAFRARIQQRWRTLERVAAAAVERQKEFLRGAAAPLVPLTRADLAADLGIHESTVCRAVARKAIALPSGRVVPFATLFDASLPVSSALRDLIAREEHALSDAELARRLQRRGFHVARRTVAKYRRRIGVANSAVRA